VTIFKIIQACRRGMENRGRMAFAIPRGLPTRVVTNEPLKKRWCEEWGVEEELAVWIISPVSGLKRLLGLKPSPILVDLNKVTKGERQGIVPLQPTYIPLVERFTFPFPFPKITRDSRGKVIKREP
jgi:hypothetical protein